jgi:hypothetical protein
LVVEHSEEGLAEARADDDDAIDEELAFGVVLVALVDDGVEGQGGEDGVEGEI